MAGQIRLEPDARIGVAPRSTGDAMPSTAIRHLDYEPATRALTVTFVTGRRYEYAGVPPDVYIAFSTAPSKGTFFNNEIRDAYEYRELERRT
jgi:hypothetical protein